MKRFDVFHVKVHLSYGFEDVENKAEIISESRYHENFDTINLTMGIRFKSLWLIQILIIFLRENSSYSTHFF